jgi:tRNA-specific 2-thiouridylase
VRAEARRAGLVVAEKGESMEICFVESDVTTFLESRLARAGAGADPPAVADTVPGRGAEMVDSEGRRLGVGAPYYRYTVGQRRGLGLGGGDRLYVLEILPQDNRVVVGAREELRRDGLLGERLHWIGPPPMGEIEATVRIRSRHGGVRSRIRSLAGSHATVEFESAQEGVAPGQAAVFYDGTRVLGGCWISGAQPS